MNNQNDSNQVSENTVQGFSKLHLGCGERYLNGYLNIDYPPSEHSVQTNTRVDLYANIIELEFEAESIEEIRLHHVFEHFDRPTAFALLCNWNKWLKKGGRLIIETPDLEQSNILLNSNTLSFTEKQAVLRHVFGSHEAAWAIHADGWYEEKYKTLFPYFGYRINRTEHTEWLLTRNIIIEAIKTQPLSIEQEKQALREVLTLYCIDNSASEQRLLGYWVEKSLALLNSAQKKKAKLNNSPLVSIFMPVYNREKYVAETLDSLLSQTFQNFELVIVDDGSIDNTVSLIESYRSKFRSIKLFKQEHKGEVAARNLALENIDPNSKYLMNHDSDDISLPTKLEKLVGFLETHPDIDLVGCDAVYFNDAGEILGKPSLFYTDDKIRATFHNRNSFINSATLFRESMYSSLGGYSEEFRSVDDYHFFSRALMQGFKGANIPESLHKIRLHDNSIGAVKAELQEYLAEKIRAEYEDYLKTQVESNTKLSILHGVEFYFPSVGGAQKVVQDISEYLVKQGHSVTVATTKLPERNAYSHNGVTIVEFDCAGRLATGYTGNDRESYKQFLLNSSFHVYMFYAAQQWTTDIALEVVSELKKRAVVVVAPCGYSALIDERTLRFREFADYFQKYLPALLPEFDACVYHSRIYKDYKYAKSLDLVNSFVIPNGIDNNEFIADRKNAFREKFKIATEHYCVCVGNYIPEKGQEFLMQKIKEYNDDTVTFVFIGKDYGTLDSLKALAGGQSNIIFLLHDENSVSRHDVVSAYQEATLFIFASKVEVFPLVILESMAAGLPYLSLDCGNVKELSGGVLTTEQEFLKELKILLSDKELREKLSLEGKELFQKRYMLQNVVSQWEKLYHYLRSQKGLAQQDPDKVLQQLNAQNEKRTSVIIFSKDRALQLDATLSSYFLNVEDPDNGEVFVIYKSTTSQYSHQYNQLKSEYVNVNFIEEKVFSNELEELVKRNEYVLFVVDDNIFIDSFSLDECVSALQSKKDSIAVSLRLGQNTYYCYPLNKVSRIPQFESYSQKIKVFDWTKAEYDFAYPLEVSSSIYRSSLILDLLAGEKYSNPNVLEGILAPKANKCISQFPYLFTYQKSVAFCNPVNKVQDVNSNRAGDDVYYSSKELADIFDNGKRIKTLLYKGFVPNGCHHEVEYFFDKPEIQSEQGGSPKFSLIMANYNTAAYVGLAIESVLNQTFADWELLIIDDGSTDNSLEVVKPYLADKRIKLLQHSKNKGYISALITGIENISSPYFGTIDSDDALAPNAVAVMYNAHINNPDAGYIYSQFYYCGKELKPYKVGYCGTILQGKTNLEADLASHFRTIKLEYYKKTPGYQLDILHAEDKDISYKMEEVSKLLFVNIPLYFYRELPTSVSRLKPNVRVGLNSMNLAKCNAIKRRSDQYIYRFSNQVIEKELPMHDLRIIGSDYFSIIIVLDKKYEDLTDFFRTLIGSFKRSYEIIVVDTAFNNDVLPLLLELKILYIRIPIDVSQAAAFKFGLSKAKGQIVVSIEPNVLLSSVDTSTLYEVLEYHDRLIVVEADSETLIVVFPKKLLTSGVTWSEGLGGVNRVLSKWFCENAGAWLCIGNIAFTGKFGFKEFKPDAEKPISQTAEPYISICVANSNYGHFLHELFNSLVAQSNSNFEVIVVDNESTDDSRKVVEKYREKLLITFIENGLGNASNAYNKAFLVAKGNYLCIVSADDALAPYAIQKYYDEIGKSPNTDMFYCNIRQIGTEVSDSNYENYFDKHSELISKIAEQQPFSIYGAVVKRSMMLLSGAFTESVSKRFDYDFIKKFALLKRFNIQHIPEILYLKRMHVESLTHSNYGSSVNVEESFIIRQTLAAVGLEELFPRLDWSGDKSQTEVIALLLLSMKFFALGDEQTILLFIEEMLSRVTQKNLISIIEILIKNNSDPMFQRVLTIIQEQVAKNSGN